MSNIYTIENRRLRNDGAILLSEYSVLRPLGWEPGDNINLEINIDRGSITITKKVTPKDA